MSKYFGLVASVAGTFQFGMALVVCGALRSEYSHITKAISELGVIGAPYATAFNIIGFFVPGCLIALSGAHLARSIDNQKGLIWWLLVISGIGFALTAIPAEMKDGAFLLDSSLTQAHFVMTLVSALPWLIGMFAVNRALKKSDKMSSIHPRAQAISWLCFLLAFANPASELLPITAAIGQRIAFVAYFGWFITMSILITSRGWNSQRRSEVS